MTFTTLLTIVPILILALSIIHAAGGFVGLEGRLESVIMDVIDPGRQEEVRLWLTGFFQNIRSGAYSGLSIVVLLLGALGLLGSVEGAFNDVWEVHRGRSLFQKFSTYTTLIVFGPILAGLSLSMTASLQTSDMWDRLSASVPLVSPLVSLLFKIIPVFITGLAFTILYMVMPNVRVRLRAALPAGIAAGVIWEFTKWGYAFYLGWATHIGTLYGSLAAFPLFLIWIYLSWIVVLFGAHLTFAQEAADDIRIEEDVAHASLLDRMRAALHIMVSAAACHRAGDAPPDVVGLAHWLGLPLRLLRTAAETLIAGGLLHQVTSHPRDWALVPARELDRITLMDIWRCFTEAQQSDRDRGTPLTAHQPDAEEEPAQIEVESLIDQMYTNLEASWGRTTLAEILTRLSEDSTETIRMRSRADVHPFPKKTP